MNKKLLTIIFGIIFLISILSSVSATMIKYNKGENGNPDLKVELKNNFLFIPLDEIGTAELKSHNSITEIKKVYSTGENVVMWYEFNFLKDYEDALGEVKFIDMRTGKETERDYSFVYLSQEEYQEPVYSCRNVTTKKNTSSVCEITSYKTKIKDVWLPYNSKDINLGKQLIGIQVNVLDKDYVDCIWEIAGKQVEKHASYLFTNLVSYYKLDETSGTTAIDSHGSNDGTANNARVFTSEVAGIINTGADFTQGDDAIEVNAHKITTEGTITLWFKMSAIGNKIISKVTSSQNHVNYDLDFDGNNLRLTSHRSSGSISGTGSTTISTGQWYFAVIHLKYGSGGFGKLYLNGDFDNPEIEFFSDANYIDNPAGSPSVQNMALGAQKSATVGLRNFMNGVIDEVGIWNRALSSTEIAKLYNSGDGFSYPFEEDYIYINLLSPTDEQNLTSNIVNFSSNLSLTGSIEIENVTLNVFYDNGTLIYNNTNSSGLEGIYNWTTTLSDGDYSWNVTALGNDSIQYNSSTYDFNIDTVSPQIEINSGNGTQTFGSLATNHTINYTITETNLDSCWLNYNGTNTTIPCTTGILNTTNFTMQYNVYNATIYANDTFGNLNSSFFSWNYKVFQNDLDYSPQGYEGQNNSIIYNMTFNGTINSLLINISNVSYAVSISYDGSNYVVSSSEIIPSTTETTNYFNLIISLSGEEILTPIISQSLTMINLAVCNSTINNSFIYFNLKNEKSITEDINGRGEYTLTLSTPYTNNIQTVNGSFSGKNASICSNINFSANNFTYYSGGKIKYTATGFSNENYNFIKQSIPKNITLYLLNLTYDIPFKITYFGDTNLPTSNQILELWKEYPSLNTYYLVEAPISSTTGEVLFNIDSENSKYLVKVYDENYVLKRTFENQIFYCDTALVSLCEEELSGEIQSETLNDPNRTIDYEINATNESIIVDYDYLDGATKSTSVTVIKKVNDVSSTIYNSTIYSSNGQFTIPLPATVKLNEQFELSLFEEDKLVFSGSFIIPPKADKNGYLISVFLLLTFVGMAMTNGTAVVLIACLGFIIAGLLLLINGIELGWNSLGYLSPLILTVGLLIWKLSNSER